MTVHTHTMTDKFGFYYEPICTDWEECPKYLEEVED